MADQTEPPPLFENIDIKDEDEDDDLFASAVQVSQLEFLIQLESNE